MSIISDNIALVGGGLIAFLLISIASMSLDSRMSPIDELVLSAVCSRWGNLCGVPFGLMEMDFNWRIVLWCAVSGEVERFLCLLPKLLGRVLKRGEESSATYPEVPCPFVPILQIGFTIT